MLRRDHIIIDLKSTAKRNQQKRKILQSTERTVANILIN